jgi:DNA replication protein DnaC
LNSLKNRENTKSFITEPRCRTCNDIGIIDIGGGNYTDCDCIKQRKKQEKVDKLFKSARIPKRYQDKTLDNFDQSWQQKAYDYSIDYIKNWRGNSDNGRSIFFVGDVGTGKSHLAYAILNKLIEKGVPGMAASVPDLLDDLRGKEDNGAIEALKEIDLLVLDDLGSQKNTEWVTERLFVILNSRYADLKPTIITSNHRLEVLEKTEGWARIVDRIIEMSRLVRVEGKSYRQRSGRNA